MEEFYTDNTYTTWHGYRVIGIDAQNTSLIAEELVADNVYNFLLDLMNSQRATNRSDFLLSEEERDAI